MFRRMKRVVAIMVCVGICMGLFAGCQKKEASKTSQDGQKTSDEVVELSFPCIWVGADSKAEVFGKMVSGFNEEFKGKYHVKIEEQTDYDAYQDKIRTMISTGAAPDIFSVAQYEDVKLFGKSGKIMDLTKYLSGKSDRYQAGVLEDAKVEGVNYAIPYEMAILPVMYNGRLLKEAGVETPTSFEDLWKVCDALKAKDIIPICQMTNDNAWTTMLWYSYAVAACGGENAYKDGLDNPAFVEAAEILKKMFEYTSSDAVGADASVVNGHFFNERAAIYTNGTWILGRIKNEGVEGLYDNLVIQPGWSKDGENGGAYINSIQAYLCAGAQTDPVKQAAVEAFFDYITDKDRILELSNSSGAIFAIDIDSSKITNPVQAEIIKQASEASFMLPMFQFASKTAVVTAFPAAVEGLVLGELTPEQFVQTLKDAE